jgi:ATP-binding cassette subfamily F protein 3
MLTDALTEFPGTIVFISHDPTFLTRISTRVIEIEEGKARSFSGDYEYYLWKKAQEVESIKETSEDLKGGDRGKDVGPTRAMASQAPSKSSAGDRRDLNKTQARLEKQVARAEAEIADCETKIKARDLELANPALYKDKFTIWSALHAEHDGWKKDLVRLTARWETLSAELDGVKQKLSAFV